MRNIFVSSTFKDMQAERDIIRQKVFPAINKAAGCHNDHIEFCDLRWGIDTLNQNEQEASIKIMNVCLNELGRSDDLMVVLLGDRYGWIPGAGYLQKLQETQNITSKIECMSATAFEIEHGVFHRNKRALVYFRKIEDVGETGIPDFYFERNSENKKYLEELKERLRNSPNCKVQEYPVHFNDGRIQQYDLDMFAERLIKDLESEFVGEWGEFDRLSDFDREQEIQWGFIKRKAKGFCARKEETDLLMKTFRSWSVRLNPEKHEKTPVHYIIGPSGIGKSTILSEIAMRLHREGWDVLPFIGGLTSESSDASRVLCNLIYYIEGQLGIEHQVRYGANKTSVLKLQERLIEVAGQYVQNHDPLIVVIDALDQFYPDENMKNLSFCPQKLNGNVRFIITCTPEIRTGSADKTVLKTLKREDRLLTVYGVLNHRHKEMPEEVISQLLKCKGTENPLYISMVMDRLMLMDQQDYKKINEHGGQSDAIALHQKDIIASLPDKLSEMAVSLFEKAGEKLGHIFTQKALQYIAISRQGLRESDLAYCMEKDWDSAAFSNLLFYLEDQFLQHIDGRIDFTHKALRQGILSGIKNADALHLKLEWCYHKKNVEDSVRASEILYHCFRKNDYRYAASVVRPIVYQDFSKDKNVLAVTGRRYAQTIAELAMPKRGEWIRKWLEFLVEDVQKESSHEQKGQKGNRLWVTLWFLNYYVLDRLPYTQAGVETGASITMYMIDSINSAEKGTWDEKTRHSLGEEVQRNFAHYKTIAGDLFKAHKEEIAPDGKSWYKGYWKNGLRDGFGEAKFPSGSSYKGEWKAGKPNGYGISTDYLGKVMPWLKRYIKIF